MTKIEKLEQKLNEFIKSISKEEMIKILEECGFDIEESKKENVGKWKPTVGEKYWFRDNFGTLSCYNLEEYNKYNEWSINNNPIFQTKEECIKYWKFRDAVKEKSYEFTHEEWEDGDVIKWVVAYDYVAKQLRVGDHRCINHFGLLYFKTEEDAQYIIDNYKEELLKYWL